MADLQRRLELYLAMFSPTGEFTADNTRYIFTDLAERTLTLVDSEGQEHEHLPWDLALVGASVALTMGEEQWTIIGYDPAHHVLFLRKEGAELNLRQLQKSISVQP